MTTTQAIWLGILQGLGEFLPISSSGHLIVVPWLLGWPVQSLSFDVALHLGTLAAVLCGVRGRLVAALRGRAGRPAPGGGSRRRRACSACWSWPPSRPAWRACCSTNGRRRSSARPALVAATMALMGGVLFLADRRAPAGRRRGHRDLPARRAAHRLRAGAGAGARRVALGRDHQHGAVPRLPAPGGRALQLPAGHADHGRRRAAQGAAPVPGRGPGAGADRDGSRRPWSGCSASACCWPTCARATTGPSSYYRLGLRRCWCSRCSWSVATDRSRVPPCCPS